MPPILPVVSPHPQCPHSVPMVTSAALTRAAPRLPAHVPPPPPPRRAPAARTSRVRGRAEKCGQVGAEPRSRAHAQ